MEQPGNVAMGGTGGSLESDFTKSIGNLFSEPFKTVELKTLGHLIPSGITLSIPPEGWRMGIPEKLKPLS